MHAVGIVLTVGFYATPIVYPASLVPARLLPILAGQPGDAPGRPVTGGRFRCMRPRTRRRSLTCGAFSLVVAAAGAALFARARPHFADLI